MKNAVIFLLDRSGSMEAIKSSTIESYNTYLAKLRESADIEYTLAQFDTIGTETVHRREPIKDIPDLTNESFKPRGGTPLIDAACITLGIAIDKYQPTDRLVFTILTDGQENSSREFKMSDLHDLIKKVSQWGWQVVFLGASIDAYKDAGAAGVSVANTMSYDSRDRNKALRAFATTAANTAEYFATGEASSMSFSQEDKAAVGDAFIDKQKPKPATYSGATTARATLVDKAEL